MAEASSVPEPPRAAPSFPAAETPQSVDPPSAPPAETPSSVQLPAVIKAGTWKTYAFRVFFYTTFFLALIAWPIAARDSIVRAVPSLRGIYDRVGLHVPPAWDGLGFAQVLLEVKYDSGATKLSVDGVIQNGTDEVQLIPAIQARAVGADKRIIQSWWVDAPAATIAAGEKLPFHTEVPVSNDRTIEEVFLEFTAREEKEHADK